MRPDLLKTALTIIEKSSQAFIASVDADGYPNLKAMLMPREQHSLKTFYFTTNTSSRRVQQYLHNPKAALYFYNGDLFLGLMLRGTVAVQQDQATKERIWRPGDEMYYAKGVTDPDYCVLEFTAERARLYQARYGTGSPEAE